MKGGRFAASLVLLLAACTGSNDADPEGTVEPSSQGVVRIALEAPITGEQASNGVDMLNGAQLAADEANAAGGVLGRQIEIVPADDEADP